MTIEFTVPETAPRRGNRLTQWIATLALRISGWQLLGDFPDVPKFIAVAAPHRTAIKDFSIGMMAMYVMGVRFSFMIKHTVVRWPIGGPIRWLGGIAINRSAAHGVVSQMAAEFKTREKLIVAVMPEGTRKNAGVPVNQWKRGFYHIAMRADVPIMPVFISYTHKRVVFAKHFYATGDIDADMAPVQQFYKLHLTQE